MAPTTTATVLLTGTTAAAAFLAVQESPMTAYLPLLVAGFVVGFVLAFAVGANDVANSFSSAVGSGVVTLRQACVLASIFETLGCVFLGAKVGATLRKGIVDVSLFRGAEQLLMAGSLSAMVGSAAWHLAASFFKLPISGTHSIVGATLGFSLVANGAAGVNWRKLALIVASWFLSPLLSGVISAAIFWVVRRTVLRKADPVPSGLRLLPVFYAFTVGVNLFSVVFTGAPMLGFDRIPWWGAALASLGAAALAAALVWYAFCPYLKRKIEAAAKEVTKEASRAAPAQEEVDPRKDDDDDNVPVYAPGNSYSQYHTVHEGSDLHRELIQQQQQQVRRSNSYTSRAAAILGMHRDLKQRAGACEDGIADDEGPGAPGAPGARRLSVSAENVAAVVAEGHVTVYVEKEDDVEEEGAKAEGDEGGGSSGSGDDKVEKDRPEVATLFRSLQIVTACFEAFAHGGNDVSNAVGPLVALWMVFSTGTVASTARTPIWLLLYGGAGISVGLCAWGRRVMETLGRNLTPITASSGFCIELASALTVLLASNAGLPVSTTHCQVGSVVAVGWLRSRAAVDWRLFRTIFLAWVLTVPVTGLISAAVMAFFTHVIL